MKRFWMLAALMLATAGISAHAAEPTQVQAERFRPKWRVGDRWTVETQSRQVQMAGSSQEKVAARWRFAVDAVEQIAGRDC